MATLHRLTVLTLTAGMFLPAVASAQAAQSTTCCSSDPHGVTIASKGLGEPAPQALNESQDASWRAFEFMRDGIWYLQVNDLSGNVHAIIGNVDTVFWTLPSGIDANRVSTPQRRLLIPTNAPRTVVYRKPNLLLVAYSTAGGVIWSIEAPDGTR